MVRNMRRPGGTQLQPQPQQQTEDEKDEETQTENELRSHVRSIHHEAEASDVSEYSRGDVFHDNIHPSKLPNEMKELSIGITSCESNSDNGLLLERSITVEASATDTLEDVRRRLMNEKSNLLQQLHVMPPNPNTNASFAFCADISSDHERQKLAWNYIGSTSSDGNSDSDHRGETLRLRVVHEPIEERNCQSQSQSQSPSPSDAIEMENDDNEDKDDGLFFSRKVLILLFLEGFIGWSPPLWLSMERIKCWNNMKLSSSSRSEFILALIRAVYFLLIFVVDIVDAIVDVILGIDTAINGSSGEKGYGVFLGTMTVMARIIAGIYSLGNSKLQDRDRIFTFFYMETAVFMIEDGAAILFVASNPSLSGDILTTVSIWLTAVCGLSYILHQIHRLVFKVMMKYWANREWMVVMIPLIISITGPIFMMYILFQEVLLKRDDDNDHDEPFSRSGLTKRDAFILYGFGSLGAGYFSIRQSLVFLPIFQRIDESNVRCLKRTFRIPN